MHMRAHRSGIDLGSIWARSGLGLGSIWDRSGLGLGSIWAADLIGSVLGDNEGEVAQALDGHSVGAGAEEEEALLHLH